jgi:hypothetical protein
VLKNTKVVLEQAKIKYKEVFDTRWLSFQGAVQAVSINLPALISALLTDKNATLLKPMAV